MDNRDMRTALVGTGTWIIGILGLLAWRIAEGPVSERLGFLGLAVLGIVTLWVATRDKNNTNEDEEV